MNFEDFQQFCRESSSKKLKDFDFDIQEEREITYHINSRIKNNFLHAAESQKGTINKSTIQAHQGITVKNKQLVLNNTK